MDPQLSSFQSGAQQTIVHLKSEYAKLQTGRASAALIENVHIEAYGQKQPLKALAGISVQDARTIVVQPWDKGTMADIEKALQKADLGTSPVNDGTVIRINFPPMTEERRTQMASIVHELAEEARISIRQQRKDVHSNVKKDPDRSEDEHRDFEREVQKFVDKANEEIEGIAKRKEEEVMTV